MMARFRKNLWFQSQAKPSLISALKLILVAGASLTALNDPAIEAISATAIKKLAASNQNGKKIAIPIIKLPSGGPTKVLVNDSALQRRPLAFSRFSLSTMEGKMVCAVLSRNTSARPKSRAVVTNTKYKK